MEWYWVVTIIVGFFVVAGMFVWLGKKGILKQPEMNVLTSVIDSLTVAVKAIASATENATIDVFAMAMTLLDKAVLAAENAYYNELITAEERKEYCMKKFNELLTACDIHLNDGQEEVIDTLIKAACEAMGHSEEYVEMVEE